MSDGDWRGITNPEQLLVYLQKQGRDPLASHRKSGLLAVACCRRMWHLLPKAHRLMVELAERIAAGETWSEDERVRLADRVEDGEGFEARWEPIARSAASAISAASFIEYRIHRVFWSVASAVAWGEALAQR